MHRMAGIENVDNSSNVEILIGEPLDTMQIKVNGKNGIQQIVPALNIGFMEIRGYVYFKSIPVITNDTGQDGFTAEEEEWLETVSFLEDDLHWLLRLPHHRFWSQVVYEEDMHKCLESYLTLAPRDYDFVNMKMKNEIRTALNKIHRLVFLVFLRMSTYKESKEHHIRPKAYGDIIYDNFVFDVPKLMDLCILYGFQNKAILTKMLKNIFSTQPRYTEDLAETCNFVLNAFSFAEEKLFFNVAGLQDNCRRLDDNSYNGIKKMSSSSFCDIISYITDACATIYMFLEIYSPACEIFRQNDAISRITSFYERTFPSVEKEIYKLHKKTEDPGIIESIKKKVILSKTFLVKTFRNILSYCCIQHILDPSYTPERIAPSEDFIEIFTDIASEKTFLHDYNSLYPFESDMDLINATGAYLDVERLNYVFGSIHDLFDSNPQMFASTAENGARPKTHSKSVPTTENGARPKTHSKSVPTTIQSLQNIGAILQPKPPSSLQNDVPSFQSADSRPSEYQMDSLIDAILEVLPDLGEGFIEEGLAYYGYDHEKFIDAIFNNYLPECLDSLDRRMKRKLPVINLASLKEDKPSILAERQNIYDNDEFDVFSRSDINMDNIHIGKKNKTPNSYQNLESEKESEFLKHLICTYGEQDIDDEYRAVEVYEDEYDDTYDSTLVGVKEPSIENEPEKEDEVEESSEGGRDTSLDFCRNPETMRQEAEERRQSKLAARNKGNAFVHDSSNNKQHKERNKAYSANHNRRKQSDFKRSKGMMSSR